MKSIMKKMIKSAIIISVLICGLLGITFRVDAAPIENIPHTIIQPDGKSVECFVSGDEYFNYIHDEDGNIIIKNYDTNEYVYAKLFDGVVVPGKEVVRQSEQSSQTKMRNSNDDKIKLSDIPNEYIKNMYASSPLKRETTVKSKGLSNNEKKYKWNNKQITNVVIFIDFPDVQFSDKKIEFYNKLFNQNNNSLKNWFNEASYGKAQVVSNLYPNSSGTMIGTYRDIHNRSFYEKKPKIGANNESTYYDENGKEVEQEDLEHPLLKRAINAVKQQIPEDLKIDQDNDGKVDCITFVIAGQSGEWNDLLWSHKWSLFTENEMINEKRAYEYVFVMEDELKNRGSNVLIHEIFHMYGAPDLYHYKNFGNRYPVGNWDVMSTANGQMTSMYMRYKYGGWINEIPEIKNSGYYTLNKTSSNANNSFVIRSPFSADEFFVLEFRKKEGYFDQNVILGTGLVIYRINSNFNGNSDYNGSSIFDEVYISETSPNKTYYPYASNVATLELRNGKKAGITIDDFSIIGDKISFRVQLTSERMAKYFIDYRIAQAIANELNKSLDAITDDDLCKITELVISPVKEYGLPLDLEGMDKLVNLQKFTAQNCKIEDISQLSKLIKMTHLNLYQNNIENISALTQLKSLEELKLRGNLIDDFSPVSGYYSNLITKDFSLNRLNDIQFRVEKYSAAGEAQTIKANLSKTVPQKIYLKFEKYTNTGEMVNELELPGYRSIYGDSFIFQMPEGFTCENGYIIIKGYERADFRQLCAELVIHPIRFKAF